MENEILNVLKVNISELRREILGIIYTSDYLFGLNKPFNPYWKYNKEKNKFRKIEPPDEIRCKYIQKPLAQILQKAFARPVYCMSGWSGTNNVINAYIHAGKKFTITADIKYYFPKTKAEYAEIFWKSLGFNGEDLDRLMNLTTFEGHLPTGAPTSNILAALIHKPLFDAIYEQMLKQGIAFTTYVDDITLSSDKHIQNGVIKYIGKVLKTHGLCLKSSKIKRFGYRGAIITGIKTTQAGKLQMPFKQGHKVIKMLKAKSIENMNEKELQKLIGKIGYIQQINPDGTIKSKNSTAEKRKQNRPYFYVTKRKAIKRLNEVIETKGGKNENE